MCVCLFLHWFEHKKIIGEQERGRKKFIGWQLLTSDKQRPIVLTQIQIFLRNKFAKLFFKNIFAIDSTDRQILH